MNEAHVIPGLNQLVVVETADGKLVELVRPQESRLVEVVTTGPQGPAGPAGPGLPNGGNPGDIVLKSSYANNDASWAPTLDGGTFF
jgi:hypothetical protein